jgi:hypothetical protein
VPQTPEHVPSALEDAMRALAARAHATPKTEAPPSPATGERREERPPSSTAPASAAEPQKPGVAAADAAAPVMPTLDEDEPLHEKVVVDRAAHDIIAESAQLRRKAEDDERARRIAEARREQARLDALRSSEPARGKRRRTFLRRAALTVLAVPLLAAAWLQFTPLNGYIPEAERSLAQRLNQRVAISTLRYVIFPTPRLVLEDVKIGNAPDVVIERVEAPLMPWTAVSGPSTFERVEAHNVEIEPEALATIPAWTGGRTAGTAHTDRLGLKAIKVKLADDALEPFDGNVVFARNGTIQVATFNNAKAKLELTPGPEGVRLTLAASDWRIPYGPPITFGVLNLRGLVEQGRLAGGEFTGDLAGGNVEGSVAARWSATVTVQGEFKIQNARIQDLARELSPNFAAKGTLKAAGRFSMQSPRWTTLTANPQLEAQFAATRGELTNIDLVRAIQSPLAGAIRGGRTAFEELTGVFQIGGGRYIFRQLHLASGPLTAGGALDVGSASQVNGRITAELTGRGARSTLLIGGTVADPRVEP